MPTRAQLGAGIGSGSLGLLTAEGIQQSAERGVIAQRQADIVAVGSAGLSLWAAVFGELGYLPLSTPATIGLGGFGAGTAGWYAGRRGGIAPRIIATVPDTVNITGPVISAVVFTSVLIGASTLAGLLR